MAAVTVGGCIILLSLFSLAKLLVCMFAERMARAVVEHSTFMWALVVDAGGPLPALATISSAELLFM